MPDRQPTIGEWQYSVHRTAIKAGWYEDINLARPRDIASLLALIHSEVSEALECVRHGKIELDFGPAGKPEGLAAELADILIRVLDLAEALDLDLVAAIAAKAAYNQGRPYRHGGKLL